MKTCLKCNIEKELDEFYKRSNEKDGKHRYCKECLRPINDKYYQDSKEQRADYYKQYREENKEYFNNYCHNHYHTNKDLYREWNKNKYENDLGFRLKHIVAARINEGLKLYQTLKNDRTIEYLGCSIGHYIDYLTLLFDDKMNWSNYAEYWEIDHIKPIDSFDLSNEEELYKCFHYTNTQPLHKTENRQKSNKLLSN